MVISGHCHLYLNSMAFHWKEVNFLCICCTSDVRISCFATFHFHTEKIEIPNACFCLQLSIYYACWLILALKRKHERFLSETEGSLTYIHLLGNSVFHWFSKHVYHTLSFPSWFCYYWPIYYLFLPSPTLHIFLLLISGYFPVFIPTLALLLI